jgi:hypothetical protein
MPSPLTALTESQVPHLHVVGLTCPTCEQPIPVERVQQVRARIEARDRELSEAAATRAAEQFATEKEQLEAVNQEALERIGKENAEALAKVTNEAGAKVAAAHDEGKRAGEAAAQLRIETLEESLREREAGWQEKVSAAERAKQHADERFEKLKEEHEDAVSRRVQEARDALEKDNHDKLNAKDAAHAAETQKLTTKLTDLTRQLEKKTADELGEGAEVKLFEALKAEFEGDQIERIGRGNSGADIRHAVIHNGRECGTIIYDSKNSTAWRNDYVSKLVQDQTAAKADHAVLCVLKFPAEAKQLAIRDGVIIVNPDRTIALVHILRKHMIQVHALRLSRSERAKKMAALYDYITSDRCGHLLGRIESHADALLTMQAKEIKAHEDSWKKQGTHLRSIQKVKAELETEIDRIIGTDDGSASTP